MIANIAFEGDARGLSGVMAANAYNTVGLLSSGRKAALHGDFQMGWPPSGHAGYTVKPELFQQYLLTPQADSVLLGTGYQPGVTPTPWLLDPSYAANAEAKAAEGRRLAAEYEARIAALSPAITGPTYVDPYTQSAAQQKTWYEQEVAKIAAQQAATKAATTPTSIQATAEREAATQTNISSTGQTVSMQANEILDSIPGPSIAIGGFNIPWLLVAGVGAVALFAFSGKGKR